MGLKSQEMVPDPSLVTAVSLPLSLPWGGVSAQPGGPLPS